MMLLQQVTAKHDIMQENLTNLTSGCETHTRGFNIILLEINLLLLSL
jgi:hypothetical protein